MEQLQADLEALKARQAAREEIKISIAAAEPVVKNTLRADVSEPHVTVAVPPCPPAEPSIIEKIITKKLAAKKRGSRARAAR